MDGPRDCSTERNKSDRERNILSHSLYVESKNMVQINLFTKQKKIHRLRKQTYQERSIGGRNRLGVWD